MWESFKLMFVINHLIFWDHCRHDYNDSSKRKPHKLNINVEKQWKDISIEHNNNNKQKSKIKWTLNVSFCRITIDRTKASFCEILFSSLFTCISQASFYKTLIEAKKVSLLFSLILLLLLWLVWFDVHTLLRQNRRRRGRMRMK